MPLGPAGQVWVSPHGACAAGRRVGSSGMSELFAAFNSTFLLNEGSSLAFRFRWMISYGIGLTRYKPWGRYRILMKILGKRLCKAHRFERGRIGGPINPL